MHSLPTGIRYRNRNQFAPPTNQNFLHAEILHHDRNKYQKTLSLRLPAWVGAPVSPRFPVLQGPKIRMGSIELHTTPPSTVEADHFTVQRWPHLPWEPKWQVILCRSTITAQLHVTPIVWVWGHKEENSRLDSHREIRQGSPIKCWIGEVTALSGWQRGGKANYPGLPGTLGTSHIPENHSW